MDPQGCLEWTAFSVVAPQFIDYATLCEHTVAVFCSAILKCRGLLGGRTSEQASAVQIPQSGILLLTGRQRCKTGCIASLPCECHKRIPLPTGLGFRSPANDGMAVVTAAAGAGWPLRDFVCPGTVAPLTNCEASACFVMLGKLTGGIDKVVARSVFCYNRTHLARSADMPSLSLQVILQHARQHPSRQQHLRKER